MSNGVLDQVSNGVTDGVAIPPYHDRFSIRVQRDAPFLRQRPGREGSHSFGSNVIEIDGIRDVQSDGIQAGNAQKLVYKPVHACDVGFDLGYLVPVLDDI